MKNRTNHLPSWLRVTALGGFMTFAITSTIIMKGTSAEPLAPNQDLESMADSGSELQAGPAARTPRIARADVPLPNQAPEVWVDLGEVQVLDGIPLRALLDQDLDEQQMRTALRDMQMLTYRLGRRLLYERPQLSGDFLDLQEAEDLSLMGGLVMRASHPENPGEEVYFPCPSDCSDVMAELQTIYLAVQNQPVLMDTLVESALDGLETKYPDERLTALIRPNGTGIEVLNGAGETLRWSFFNVPGKVLTMNPR